MSGLRYQCLVLDHDDTVMDSTRLIHHPAFEVFLKKVRPGVTVSLEEYFRLNFHPGFLEYCEQVLHLTPDQAADLIAMTPLTQGIEKKQLNIAALDSVTIHLHILAGVPR